MTSGTNDAGAGVPSRAMSVWRRKAIESFPELRRELNDRREIETIYGLWFELLSLWRDAHTAGNDEKLDRIYRYADWCFQQRTEDLWNSAGVCFYEHVLDHGDWERVLARLSDSTISDMWGLWEYSSEADMAAVAKYLQEQKRPVPPSGAGLIHPALKEELMARTRANAPKSSRGRGRSTRRGTRPRRDQRP